MTNGPNQPSIGGNNKTDDCERNGDCHLEQHLRRIIAPLQHAEESPADDGQNNHQPNRSFHDFESRAHGKRAKLIPSAGMFFTVFTVDWTMLARRGHADKRPFHVVAGLV